MVLLFSRVFPTDCHCTLWQQPHNPNLWRLAKNTKSSMLRRELTLTENIWAFCLWSLNHGEAVDFVVRYKAKLILRLLLYILMTRKMLIKLWHIINILWLQDAFSFQGVNMWTKYVQLRINEQQYWLLLPLTELQTHKGWHQNQDTIYWLDVVQGKDFNRSEWVSEI